MIPHMTYLGGIDIPVDVIPPWTNRSIVDYIWSCLALQFRFCSWVAVLSTQSFQLLCPACPLHVVDHLFFPIFLVSKPSCSRHIQHQVKNLFWTGSRLITLFNSLYSGSHNYINFQHLTNINIHLHSRDYFEWSCLFFVKK